MLIFYALLSRQADIRRNCGTHEKATAAAPGDLRHADENAGWSDLVGQSSSHVCNWRRFSGRIPAKFYLIIQEALAEQGFVAANHLFNFAKRPPRKKRRSVYCEPGESRVIYADFRRRKVRLAA